MGKLLVEGSMAQLASASGMAGALRQRELTPPRTPPGPAIYWKAEAGLGAAPFWSVAAADAPMFGFYGLLFNTIGRQEDSSKRRQG